MIIRVESLMEELQSMADRLADEIRECDRLREENTVLRGDISEMRAENRRLRAIADAAKDVREAWTKEATDLPYISHVVRAETIYRLVTVLREAGE